ENPAVRKGRFLWRDEKARERYLAALIRRINNGYYSTDKVLWGIVEELAPVFCDSADPENL
ncbi:MAG: hypothetical protein ACLFSB_09015, partial [Chitinispirillaceae bacterium]